MFGCTFVEEVLGVPLGLVGHLVVLRVEVLDLIRVPPGLRTSIFI